MAEIRSRPTHSTSLSGIIFILHKTSENAEAKLFEYQLQLLHKTLHSYLRNEGVRGSEVG